MAEAPPPAGGEAGERAERRLSISQQEAGQAHDQQREDDTAAASASAGQRSQQKGQAAPPPAMRGAAGAATAPARNAPRNRVGCLLFVLVGRRGRKIAQPQTRFTRRGSASTHLEGDAGGMGRSARPGSARGRRDARPARPGCRYRPRAPPAVSTGPTRSSNSSIVARPSAMSVPSGRGDQLRAVGDVVLVLDLADDLLDQILDGDEPVDAAELVDDERQMLARQAHLQQQVEHPHGGRHEQHLAQDRLQIEGPGSRRAADAAQQILDVDEADDVVEGFAIDRQARMAMGAELAPAARRSRCPRPRAMMSARGTITSLAGQIAQPDDVAQQAALAGGRSALRHAPPRSPPRPPR